VEPEARAVRAKIWGYSQLEEEAVAVATQSIRLTVNGKSYDLDVRPNRLLLETLRENLGLTGSKEGCGIGVCGACTVLVDGKMVSSCLMLAVMADRAAITTIEGLARGDELDAIQRAFIEHGGFQCGICTPGQILAARALLDESPNPTEDDVKEWMMGNLCRCTGYYKIAESIVAAAQAEAAS
jgi:aerobic carbon-monoxide dehydrogenase small subunit